MCDAQEAVTLRAPIKDHRFLPPQLKARANTPIMLVVRNFDATPEAFESKMLWVEKVEISIKLRPFIPRRYHFYDDFNEAIVERAPITE
jgi:hypothetical protein